MVKFIWEGKFNGDIESLPKREHPSGYVRFKEPTDMKKFSSIMNTLSLIVFILTYIMCGVILKTFYIPMDFIAAVTSLLIMVPHEFLHAMWFKEEAHIYTNLKQGMLFVLGTEDISKSRFIWLSLFPFIVFGFIPLVTGLYLSNYTLIWIGMLHTSSCVGDFYNVFNTITQVPNGAKTYLSGFNSYWYIPNKGDSVGE